MIGTFTDAMQARIEEEYHRNIRAPTPWERRSWDTRNM